MSYFPECPLYAPVPLRSFTPLFVPQQEYTLPFDQKNHLYIQSLFDLLSIIQQYKSKSAENPYAKRENPPIEQTFRMFFMKKETLSTDELLLTLFVFFKASCMLAISSEQPDFFTLALIYAQPLFISSSWDATLLFSERTWVRALATQHKHWSQSFLFGQTAPLSLYPDPLHPQNLHNRDCLQKWHAFCYWISRVVPMEKISPLKPSLSFHKWLQQMSEDEIIQFTSQRIIETASLIDYFCLFFTPCGDLQSHLSQNLGTVFQTDPSITSWIDTCSFHQWLQLSQAHGTASSVAIYIKNPQIRLEIIANSTRLKFSNALDLSWIRSIDASYVEAILQLLGSGHIPKVFGPQIAYELMHHLNLAPHERTCCVTKILSIIEFEPIQTTYVCLIAQKLLFDCQDLKEQSSQIFRMLLEKTWSYSDRILTTPNLRDTTFLATRESLCEQIQMLEQICTNIERERLDALYANCAIVCLFYALELKKSYQQIPLDSLIVKKNQAIVQALQVSAKVADASPYKTKIVSTIAQMSLASCSEDDREIRIKQNQNQLEQDQLEIENPDGVIEPFLLEEFKHCFSKLSHVQSNPMHY